MKTVFALVALVALFATSEATFTFMANYTMYNSRSYPMGYMNGVVYYHFVAEDPLACRLRFDTFYVDLEGNTKTHSELYHYEVGGIYTICDHCDTAINDAQLDPWQMFQGEYCSLEDNDYYRCQKDGQNLREIVTKGDPEVAGSGFDIKYVRLNDGREFYLSNLQMIEYSNFLNKFEVDDVDGCPAPVCRSYVDVVFVLDASGSVSDDEWIEVKNFLTKAARHFNVGPYDAHIGIVEFTAPTSKCCYDYPKCKKKDKWKPVTCEDPDLHLVKRTKPTRYLSDCAFDTRCSGNKAQIMFGLTCEDVDTKVSNITRISGGTCQRYGLIKAHEMLFGPTNPRCPNPSDRTDCPTPVVIAVTDGADYCHNSTEQWATKIKNDGGLLLEVGVGFDSWFDEEYIVNLSSKLGNNSLALNVSNYDHIEEVLEKMIKPVCTIGQSSGGSCGTTCKGFCACGDCVCPSCVQEASTICREITCVNHSAENGCYESDKFNQLTDDPKCFNTLCDPDASSPDDMWYVEPVDCKQELGLKECQYVLCHDGCNESNVYPNHTYCQELIQVNCKVGMCDPTNDAADPETGCIVLDKDCSTVNWASLCDEGSITCNPDTGNCEGENCLTNCFEADTVTPKCPDEACKVVSCDPDTGSCSREDLVCPENENNCKENICYPASGECIEVPADKLGCSLRNVVDGCKAWSCDPTANISQDGKAQGGCVYSLRPHKIDNCTVFECGEDDDYWRTSPLCPTYKSCKVNRCDKDTASCYEVNVECRGRVSIPNKCFQAACKEPEGCYRKQYRGAYFDVCGNCIRQDDLDSSDAEFSMSSDSFDECAVTSDEDLPTEGLAAAAIALIIIGVILIGATIALSSIVGTKILIERARGAANQSAVSNPMFEDSHKEMSNPVYEETEDNE